MTQTIPNQPGRASSTGVTVQPAAGRIGAEISGVDISRPLDPRRVAAIQSALDTWKVVFFRDQHLDHAAQIAFGRQFGELTYAHPHDDDAAGGLPRDLHRGPAPLRAALRRCEKKEREAVRKYSYTSGWHTDVTPAHNPPAGSILRADVVPGYGGDTTFTNLVAAYEGLSEPVRAFVDTLRAEHRYGANWPGCAAPPAAYSERIEKNSPGREPSGRPGAPEDRRARPVRQPGLRRPHRRRSIRSRAGGSSSTSSNEITRPEYTVRFRWEPGSVAFWDNRATAHLGPQDLGHLDVERVLHRVTLIGEVPVGPDGRESELVEGRAVRRHAGVRPTAG